MLNCYNKLSLQDGDGGRLNFPNLLPIYSWQVPTLWVNYPLLANQLGQLSLPSLWGW